MAAISVNRICFSLPRNPHSMWVSLMLNMCVVAPAVAIQLPRRNMTNMQMPTMPMMVGKSVAPCSDSLPMNPMSMNMREMVRARVRPINPRMRESRFTLWK